MLLKFLKGLGVKTMIKPLLFFYLALSLILTSCSELETSHQRGDTGSSVPDYLGKPSGNVTVAEKRYIKGECLPSSCSSDEYGLYYTDGTYLSVSTQTYYRTQIGDKKL